MDKYKFIRLCVDTGDHKSSVFQFRGMYDGEHGTDNWKYYITDDGTVIHIRKSHLIYVLESENELDIIDQSY